MTMTPHQPMVTTVYCPSCSNEGAKVLRLNMSKNITAIATYSSISSQVIPAGPEGIKC